MYPDRELSRLAAHKVALRQNIADHRAQCAAAAARATQPLAWVDRMLALWRRLSPLAEFTAVPLSLLVQRAVSPRLKILRTLVRWSPLVFGVVRVLGRATKTRAMHSNSTNA
jgi:hypothetical protein